MVSALALAAAAASFPTGFGFGAGYGSGVRIGYDVIYPKIAPFARKITDDILAAVDNLFGTGGAVQSGGLSGFDFAAGDKDRQQPFSTGSGGGRTGPAADIVQPVPEGRLAGAADLKTAVTNVVDTATNPFTRTEIVHFSNYKAAAKAIGTASSSNRISVRVKWKPMLLKAKTWIESNSSFQRYYDWLTR